jgi:hypothetical protein
MTTARTARTGARRWMTLALPLLLGCEALPPRSQPEDQSRRVAPIPACVLHLAPRGAQSEGTLRRLKETEIAKLVFPQFEETSRRLSKNAISCTGEPLLEDPLLVGGAPLRRGGPWTEEDGDVLYGAGGDRIKVVWLRVLGFPDGTVGGPLAIIRGTEEFAELFALGVYRGLPGRVSLGTARLGSGVLVTAENDGCAGREGNAACENSVAIFLPQLGALRRVVDAPAERIAYAAKGERGATGELQYRLTSTMDYRADGIHLLEQLAVSDEAGVVLRRSERERIFVLNSAGSMTASVPPLWDGIAKVERKPEVPARVARRP